MTLNMEVKKDGLRQMQDGIWKLSLTILPEDMPVDLLQAPMGTPYGLAMVPIDYDNPETDVVLRSPNETGDKTEGEKLRTRAVLLCKDGEFQRFLDEDNEGGYVPIALGDEDNTKAILTVLCNIKSRSKLATDIKAQEKFKELDEKFKQWKMERQYKDNLDR